MINKILYLFVFIYLLNSCNNNEPKIVESSIADPNLDTSVIKVMEEDGFVRMRFDARDIESYKKISFYNKRKAKDGEDWDIAFSYVSIAINGGFANRLDGIFFPSGSVERTGNWKVATINKKFDEVSLDIIKGRDYLGNIIANLVIDENKFRSDSSNFYAIGNPLFPISSKTWEFDPIQGVYNYEKIERKWADAFHENHTFEGKQVSVRRIIPLEKTFIFKSGGRNPKYVKVEIEDFYKDRFSEIETPKEDDLSKSKSSKHFYKKFKGEGYYTIRYAFLN